MGFLLLAFVTQQELSSPVNESVLEDFKIQARPFFRYSHVSWSLEEGFKSLDSELLVGRTSHFKPDPRGNSEFRIRQGDSKFRVTI